MESKRARIEPLKAPYPAEAGAWLAKWMPPGVTREPLLLFRTLATHMEFAGRMRPLGAGILGPASRIAAAERELVIARTCARCGCEYEWGVHVASLGRQAGLSEAMLRATLTAGAQDPLWRPRQRLLIELVDALHDAQRVPAPLWEALRGHWDDEEMIELIVTVGWYHLISFVANGLELPPEEWAARWSGAAQPVAG
jgi:alkylhydroperoxidase family enzyme